MYTQLMSKQQRQIAVSKIIKRIKEVISHPQFLRYVEYYIGQFKEPWHMGQGRWLKEWDDMLKKHQFEPIPVRQEYIKILLERSTLGYQRASAIYTIGIYAEDATRAYIDVHIKSKYSIVLITGEVATDDDDDEYTDLSYDEACQICQALNEEAEEELFKIKKL